MKKIDEFLYGSVLKVTRYDTEQTIEENFIKMKAAGLSTVVIWPGAFWWEEKGENYPFAMGLKILELAEKHGIKIIMELAGQLSAFEYMPDFKCKEEYFARDKSGNIEEGQSSFGFLNYFHPEVNSIICEHFSAAARAYKNCPALIGYDIFNETMFRSFDEYTISEFRTWLKEKYGSLERLNEVWERSFGDWAEVRFETWMWMSVMPRADHAAFKKASIARFMKNWSEAIRREDSEHFLIADNIHSMVSRYGSYDRPQDDFGLLDFSDEMGMSFYPKQVSGCMSPPERWQVFDGFFAASRRKGFLISEMQTHIQALFNPTTAVRPYELKLWCYEAAAAGAKGIIYWMWRQFDKGLQTLGRGLVDHQGRPTERLSAATEIGKALKFGILTPVKAKVGIVYDPLCEDIQRTYTASYSVENDIYLQSIFGAYKAFFDNNVSCDIITLDEIEDYSAIVLANHIVLSEKTGERIRNYVNSGGKIITAGKLAVVDETSRAYFMQPGAGMSELFGYEWRDTDYEGLEMFGEKEIRGFYTHEITDCLGVVEATFKNGDAAIIRNTFGRGETIAVNSDIFYGYSKLSEPSIKEFIGDISERFSLKNAVFEGDIKLRLAENEGGRYLFAFNYSDENRTAHISEILGESADIRLEIPANSAILEEIK